MQQGCIPNAEPLASAQLQKNNATVQRVDIHIKPHAYRMLWLEMIWLKP